MLQGNSRKHTLCMKQKCTKQARGHFHPERRWRGRTMVEDFLGVLHLVHDFLQHDAQLFPRLQRLDRRVLPPAFLLVCFHVRVPLRFSALSGARAHGAQARVRNRADRISWLGGARKTEQRTDRTSLSCCFRSSAACVASRSLSRTSSAVVLRSSSASVSSLPRRARAGHA